MNETVKEWIDKAEGDIRTAHREFNAEEYPNYDAACFHAQQCIEKLMKALLIDKNVIPPKTHDLIQLSKLLETVYDGWEWSLEKLRFLSRSSAAYRYPGELAEREETEEALDICTKLRDKLLNLL